MKKYTILLFTVLTLLSSLNCFAQPAGIPPGGRPDMPGQQSDSWIVNIRPMSPKTRAEITETMEQLDGSDQDKSILANIGSAVSMGLVSGLVDVVVKETFNLANYRKKQKQEWLQMIQNENFYTDSLTSIQVLNDFYASNSSRGALDPSNINFDGIEIRGIRNGHEVLYMACSIDKSKLDHMFRHSKFYLVLDTLAFNPYECHLPNITANGIRTMNELKKGKAHMRGDTILRPGKGGNGFSFDERNNLRVSVDFSLSSSWINQAVQVHKNVELGQFKFTVNIPDSIIGTYNYSRDNILKEAQKLPEKEREEFLARNLISIEGDSFVVPRSFMPLDNGKPMWGTGEYSIKVKIKESCQFDDNSDKAKHWREDYKRLRQMQNRSGEVREYFQTLWNQYGNTLVKTSYQTALSTGATGLMQKAGIGATGALGSSGMSSAAAAMGASKQAGQSPESQTPPAK